MENLNIFADPSIDTSASIFTTDDVDIETSHDYVDKYRHTNPALDWDSVGEVAWKRLAFILNINIEITGGKARRAIDKAAEILAGGKKLKAISTEVPTEKKAEDIVAKAEAIKAEISAEETKEAKRKELLEKALNNVKKNTTPEIEIVSQGTVEVQEMDLIPAQKTIEPAPVKATKQASPAKQVAEKITESPKEVVVAPVDKMAMLGNLFAEVLGINNKPQADVAQIEEIAMAAASKVGEQIIEKMTVALNAFSAQVNERLGSSKTTVEVKKPDMEAVKVGHVHKQFEDVLMAASAHIPLFLAGVSGSGKTHVCRQVADGLELPMAVIYNPSMEIVRERLASCANKRNMLVIDNLTDLSAIDYINSAMMNIEIHEDFTIIITGREIPDNAGAFVVMPFEIDEDLEMTISPSPKFTKFVQKARKEAPSITPNASINGGNLILAGWSMEKVIDATIKYNLPAELKLKVDIYPVK